MSRFDRYLLSQLMMLFGFFALVLVSVYWVNRAVRLFDQLISDGQSAWVFLEFTALTLPYVIRLVLPVAAFVAAVYLTNRLAAESELAVMQATGFSPLRLARPVILFGVIVAALVSVLSHALEPAARGQLAERRGEIAANVSSRFLVEGAFVHPAAGITLYIREITPQGELRDVFLSDKRDAARQVIYTAQRAALVRSDTGPKLVMFDGLAETLAPVSRRLSVTRFADFSYDVGALIAGPAARMPTPDELPTRDLLTAAPDTVALTGAPAPVLQAEGHERFVQALLGIASPLIGFAALVAGGFSRVGLWRQVALAVLLLIAMSFLGNVAADVARRNGGAWPVVYLPPVLGAGAAAALLVFSGRSRRVPVQAPSAAAGAVAA